MLWRNPVEFYAQSGRLELPETEGPQAELVGAESFMGNSVLRGARD